MKKIIGSIVTVVFLFFGVFYSNVYASSYIYDKTVSCTGVDANYHPINPKTIFGIDEEVVVHTNFFEVCGNVSIKHVLVFPDDSTAEMNTKNISTGFVCWTNQTHWNQRSGLGRGDYKIKTMVRKDNGEFQEIDEIFFSVEAPVYNYTKSVPCEGISLDYNPVNMKYEFEPEEEVFIHTSFSRICGIVYIKHLWHFPDGTSEFSAIKKIDTSIYCWTNQVYWSEHHDFLLEGIYLIDILVCSDPVSMLFVKIDRIKVGVGVPYKPPLRKNKALPAILSLLLNQQ